MNSAVIDNIPFTATMLPVMAYLTEVIPGADGGHPLVDVVSRSLPWPKWDYNRSQFQPGYGRGSRKGTLPDILCGVSQGSIPTYGAQRDALFSVVAFDGELSQPVQRPSYYFI